MLRYLDQFRRRHGPAAPAAREVSCDGPSDRPAAGNDVGELLAEFLGTFVLIAFGDGVVAMAVAALNQSGRGTEIFAAAATGC